MCFDEWLEECFGLIARSPYGDTIDEVWVDMGVVEFGHDFGGDEFIGVSEAVDRGLEFCDDVIDGLVVFEIVLDHKSKESG